MNSIKSFVQENMIWLLLAGSLGIYLNVAFMGLGTWNLNRSITWGWTPTSLLWKYTPSLYSSLIIFNIGYGILYLLKRKTNFTLSILQLALIALFIISAINYYFFSLFSWMVFILNLVYSKR